MGNRRRPSILPVRSSPEQVADLLDFQAVIAVGFTGEALWTNPANRGRPLLMGFALIGAIPLTVAGSTLLAYHVGAIMRREARLQGLSSDHHRSLVLVRKIRESLAGEGSIDEIASELESHYQSELEEHFNVEEELLLPELSSKDEPLATRTLSDHRLLRSLVADGIRGELDALRTLADVLEGHVRFEERELYPACEIAVPASVLDEVAFRVPHR